MSLNKVILVGNLGRTPELRKTPSGKVVTTLNLATNEDYKDSSGAKRTDTQWHQVTVWGKQAENCCKYLVKGRQVCVEGKLRTHQYVDKENVKRYLTEVVASDVKFMSGGPRVAQENKGEAHAEIPTETASEEAPVRTQDVNWG